MYCMNCGQQLPDGAKFCMSCGTPQGAISPNKATNNQSVDLGGSTKFVPAMCPNCSAHMSVDPNTKTARCAACGTECIVQDAINALTVKGNVQVGNATITVNGANTESLLQRVEIMLSEGDFVGAMQKCDTILDSDPTNGKVYLFMLMSNLGCRRREDLYFQLLPFESNQYYINAMRYGDDSVKNTLNSYCSAIRSRQRNPQIGETVYFGTTNGQRLVWKIINADAFKALIICSNVICYLPYHQTGQAITWTYSTVRKWLNYDFMNTYLSPLESSRVLSFESKKKTNDPRIDRVVLLSTDEIKYYFPSEESRALGVAWWLRKAGMLDKNAAHVNPNGSISTNVIGGATNSKNLGIRPMMWVDLNP